MAPSDCTVDENEQKCQEGFLTGLDGKCIKKFVIPKRKECLEPKLKFGGHNLQFGGRVVNFWCEDGWTLVQPEFESSVCKLGQWSKPTPHCVRPGCDELQSPEKGKLLYKLDGALASFTVRNK
jgi:hypothetical protein